MLRLELTKSDLTEFKSEPGEFKSDLSVCC
jgi:hypothetical protein